MDEPIDIHAKTYEDGYRDASQEGGQKMKLWLLKADEGNPAWHPWYDKTFGYVVRAETEKEARALAQENGGPETEGNPSCPAWTEYASCVELTADGSAEIVLEHYRSA